MDLDEIKQVLEMMREHDLAEFELERDGVKLRLRKNIGQPWNGSVAPHPQVAFVPAPFDERDQELRERRVRVKERVHLQVMRLPRGHPRRRRRPRDRAAKRQQVGRHRPEEKGGIVVDLLRRDRVPEEVQRLSLAHAAGPSGRQEPRVTERLLAGRPAHELGPGLRRPRVSRARGQREGAGRGGGGPGG